MSSVRTLGPPKSIRLEGKTGKILAADLNKSHVVQVAVGRVHGIFLTNEGVVYSWGTENKVGQLGRTAPSAEQEKKPAPVTMPEATITIVQIACGKNHCLALSDIGALYCWGSNKGGALGLHFGEEESDYLRSLIVKTPTLVGQFNGNQDGKPFEPSHIVKSCSCGSESSACVTVDGIIWVWGMLSHLLHRGRYKGKDNCTKPVKLKPLDQASTTSTHMPEIVTLSNTTINATVCCRQILQELEATISVLKSRHGALSRQQRLRAAGSGSAQVENSEDLGLEELNVMKRQFTEQHAVHVAMIKDMEKEIKQCEKDMSSIGRDLTVCDQQDTALTEQASSLEVERNDIQLPTQMRNNETKLNDISHFKESNRRTKMKLLADRDMCEQKKWKLHQQVTLNEQEKDQLESRQKLLRALAKNDGSSKGGGAMVDDCVRIAFNKNKELAATKPQQLAGDGKFNGLRDVLVISDRALNDVSSALKEVSAVAPSGGDGQLLEEMLGVNLKIRKDINNLIVQKVSHAESGASGRAVIGQTEPEGMHQFFKEAAMPGRGDSPGGDMSSAMEGTSAIGNGATSEPGTSASLTQGPS